MKIAVTGASGFIGTEVLRELRRIPEVEVVALTRSGDLKGQGWRQTDFSVPSLREIFRGVQVVVHLAAVRGTAGRISDYQVNEVLTENILIAMGEAGVEKILFASSIAVYSNTATIPWREDGPAEPKTLYGITKASCENLCRYYGKKYSFSCTVLRIAQVLGLGERRRGMMNVFLEAARDHRQLHVMGRSSARRQYIYVRDLAAVIGLLAIRPREGFRIVNVGMETACTNLEIAEIINRVFENPVPIDYDDSRDETIESSWMDVGYLIRELKYRPAGMEQALRAVREEMEQEG